MPLAAWAPVRTRRTLLMAASLSPFQLVRAMAMPVTMVMMSFPSVWPAASPTVAIGV